MTHERSEKLRTITFDDSTHKLVPREPTSEIIRDLESEIKDCAGFFVGFTYAWRKAVLGIPEYCDKSLYQEPLSAIAPDPRMNEPWTKKEKNDLNTTLGKIMNWDQDIGNNS